MLTPTNHRLTRKPAVANRGEDAMKTRKQVIKMLLLVIALFLICYGPRLIMGIAMAVGLSIFSATIYRVRVAVFLLPVVHACINPFVYCFMSANFQRSARRRLSRMGIQCPQRRQRPPLRSRASTTGSTRHSCLTVTTTEL